MLLRPGALTRAGRGIWDSGLGLPTVARRGEASARRWGLGARENYMTTAVPLTETISMPLFWPSTS